MHVIFKTAKHSPAEQERIKSLIQEHSTEHTLDLTDIFWIVRLFGDKQAEDIWKREQDSARQAGFTRAQLAQYRQYFVTADEDGSGYLTAVEIQEVFDKALNLNPAQVQNLRKELHALGDGFDCVDFPEFLRLMRVVTAICE